MDVACGGAVPDGYGQDKPTFDAPEQVLDAAPAHRASIETSCGTIELELLSGEAPFTANNFAFLAGEGFYDATVVHRVVPGFVVQMGDPTGTGTGGPGYRFADELEAARERGYARGTVAMANAGPDTNGSQFFVCLDDVALPPQYAVFGQVTGGMEVVDAIAALPLEGETPAQTCFVERVTVANGPFVFNPGDSMYEVPPDDDAAIEAFVAQTAEWLDTHLTDLQEGGPGTLEAVAAEGMLDRRHAGSWRAVTSGLAGADRLVESAVYTFVVGVDGDPQWLRVTVETTWEDGDGGAAEFVFVPADGLPTLLAAGRDG
jgi:cyclophilin family peptidyl-prolyl cis-trans isomerase